MTSEDQVAVENRTGALTCLFCDCPRITEDELKIGEVNGDGPQQNDESFWICPGCEDSEQDRNKALDASLLVEEGKMEVAGLNEGLEKRSESKRQDENCCACQACMERRELEVEQERELQTLQKAWVQLRYAVRQMYRDGLDKDGSTGKGKSFNIPKLKELVRKLCSRDPHQLYQRLESQGREYVMEMKVNLLQILISPEKVGVPCTDNPTEGNLTLDQTKCFLKAALDSFSQFQDTVRNMHGFMQELDRVHLEKFGITWKVVHHHLFDSVIYEDPLIQTSIPNMSAVLKIELVTKDEESTAPKKTKAESGDLPPAAYELAQSFRALDRLMRTSRQIWEKAHQRMEDYAAKQMKLYKATLKAKQKMLREDLEFFKQQRRLLENYVSKSKDKDKEEIKQSTEEDMSHFAETLRGLLAGGRPGRQHAASTTECSRCQQRHCPCDECTISHVITCGLISEDDAELELPPSMLEDLPILGRDLEDLDRSSFSGTSSDSDEEESEGDENDPSALGASMVCPRRRAMICSGGENVTATQSGKLSSAPIPSHLYSLHDHRAGGPDVQRYLQNAYGDWEVPWDSAAQLFPGFSLDLLRRKHREDSAGGSSSSDTKSAPSNADAQPTVRDKETNCQHQQQRGRSPPKLKGCNAPPKDVGGSDGKQRSSSGAENGCKKKQSTGSQSSLEKIPPDLLKIMKDETLTKAITMAAARRGLVKPPTNWKDLEKLDWKDLNIDAEALKKVFSQHTGDQKPPSKPRSLSKDADTIPTHDSGDDDDEDSWSDDRSSASQKDGKHCDCCYCEMFGHGGIDSKPCGRDEYPQIRERLRLKLKKKTEPPQQEVVCQSEAIQGFRGTESVEELLEFINGPSEHHGKQSDKSVKRQRQKQKKEAEKTRRRKMQTKVKPNGDGAPASESKPVQHSPEPRPPTPQHQTLAFHRQNSESPKKKNKRKGGSETGKDSVEEVFRPREDLDHLDEVDRDVENFKKFVMDCRPQENRTKVQLNLTGILKSSRRV